jgi:hypothetical protein
MDQALIRRYASRRHSMPSASLRPQVFRRKNSPRHSPGFCTSGRSGFSSRSGRS